MKVGIIVHSYTGNTLSVAQRLKDQLVEANYLVELKQVTAVDEKPSEAGNIQLKTIPDVNDYDGLIFGAPVRAFSLSPAMKAYLLQLPSLAGKKVGCFVTQHFRYKWMGGNRSIKQMKKICRDKGTDIWASGIINWSHPQREEQIAEAVESLLKL